MRIPAQELSIGDIVRVHDWRLHVIAVDHDVGTSVLTEEFDFLLHFTQQESVEVEGRLRGPSAAA
jgi:hypothetical protein